MPVSLDLTDVPADDDLATIGTRLSSFNADDVGPSGHRSLAVFLRDDDGAVVGGVVASTAWGWLFVRWLFVPEELRGQGYAGRMLTAAEEEARRRGCHGAWIDTFNPAALAAYRRQGYAPFGDLPDFPPGRTRTFLRKMLTTDP